MVRRRILLGFASLVLCALLDINSVTCKSHDCKKGNSLSCIDDPGMVGTCLVLGGPHYRTFDGRDYIFMGNCTYTLVKNCHVDTEHPAFEIQISNERLNNTEIYSMGTVVIKVYGQTITLVHAEFGLVRIQNSLWNLPISLDNDRITLTASGLTVVLETDFGLSVQYNWEQYLMVTVPDSYMGKVCGLCGNFNSNGNDDLTTPSGSDSGSVAALGKSWLVPGLHDSAYCTDKCVGQCDKCKSGFLGLNGGAIFGNMPLMTAGPLQACKSIIDPAFLYGIVRFDTCMGEGLGKFFCNTIQIYIDVCQRAGGKVPSLIRKILGCGNPKCPENSHFDTCASACPATCETPDAPSKCRSPCVEACTCNEGYVLSGYKCVPKTQCGCVYVKDGQKRYLQAGESFWGDETCTRKCTCIPNTGKVECEATTCSSGKQCGVVNGVKDCYPVLSATCSISGDPHYKTFDNTFYDFQGNCTYIASKACHLDGTQLKPFTVQVENERWRGVSLFPHVSVAKLVSVKVYDLTLVLRINQRGIVIVNDVLMQIPLNLKLNNGQVQVYQEGFHYVISTDFGLKVTYDLVYHVTISVPTSYQGKTCGLCGNLNGNKNDDLRLPDGKETKDINSFGDAWMVPVQGVYCDRTPPAPVCEEAKKRVYEATCNIITNPSGPFAACHKVLTPDNYFSDCVYDVCLTGGNNKVLCESITAYMQDCQSLGVAIKEWRTPTFCPLYCPVNSFYQICAEPCATPCPGLKGVTCPLQCAEGCACSPGYYFNGTGCVQKDQCGCYYNGQTFQIEQSVITDDCRERLTCLSPGQLKREPVKCNSNEICSVENHKRGCYPPKVQCPENSHFETCASACPATCENLNAPFACQASCVQKCTCDEGFVLRDQKCVPRTECGGAVGGGCVYTMGGQRQHLQTGESVWGDDTCTRKCTCMPNTGKVECKATSCRSGEQCGVVNGKRDCYPVAPKSSATCSISAGTHYRTFDNTIYNFQSNCTYIASKACHLEGTQVKPFTVEVENGRLRRVSPLSDLSVAKSVSVEVYGLTLVLQMNQKGAVIVNGVSAYLPLSLHNGQVQVYQEGFHYVIATDFGLKVTYDLEYHVAISVPTSYQGKTCGLCGNLNGNKNDDLRLPDGKETKDINSFGNAWIVPGQGAYCNKALPTPTCQEATKRVYEATCNIITNPSGPFAACHRVLTPESYFNDCVYDLCSSEGARKMLCDSIAAYVQDCQSLGVAVQSWRTPTFCPLYCPVNSFYQICAEPCATPCPGLKGVTCPLQCAEGCACNPGYYFNGTGCVLAYQCGCYDKGRTYKVGESVITDDCSERLTCLYSGHLKREPVKCSSDEICRIQNYERGCYPVKGQCPKNSHFETCASACPATCENPNAPATCHSSCVEACTCDEGFVLRDQKCVRRTECGGAVGGGCVYTMGGQRQHLQTGESVWGDDTCTRKCTCMPNTGKVECEATSCRSGEQCGVVNGKRDCYPVAPKSSATCSISAGTHYRTFDNTIYNFQSNCTYIASKACHLEGTQVKPFTVEVENGRLRRVSPLSDLSVAKSVSVEVYGLTLVLQMNQKGAVIVNGVSAYLPLSLHNGQVQVYQEGFHYVIATDFGLKVTYDLEYHVAISVPTSYQGKTCGLCGNLNGNKNDDLRLPDGKETKDINSFGNAWIVPGQGAYCNKALPTPTCQEATKRVYEATCNIITNPSGPFAACHRVLTPESYFNDCVYDLCSSEGARKMLCDSIAAYVQDCQSLGVAVQSWRTPTFCPLYCPVNSFYQICAEPCATPCPGLKGVTCPLQCAEGCACNPGYYFNGTGCVLAYQCGCYDKGRTYKVGESVITDDCSERLTCLYSGHLKREPVKCSSDEICRIQNYERGCYPVKGQCPKNSHFETCASACPATCENPNAPATCHSSCVEACTCDEGFVLRDQKCVRRTECGGAVGGGCVYTMGGQRQHLQTGESVWGDDTCTRKCTCMPNTGKVECEATSCRSGEQCGVVNGKRDCYPVAPKSSATCSISAGTHYRTFDNTIYNFQSNCTYIASKACHLEGTQVKPFTVEVENGRLRRVSPLSDLSVAKSVSVEVYGLTLVLQMNQKGAVIVNGVSAYLPLSLHNGQVQVYQEGFHYVIATDFGLKVTYDLEYHVAISVPTSYQGKTCGLCGNLNGNKNDDLRLPDGKETKDINSFGNAWIVPGQGAYCNKALPTPTCQEATKRVYEATCNIITNPSGPFAACHRVLTPESYFNDCVYDLCSSEGARKMLCDSIAAYVQDCQSLGVAVQSWRTPTFCPLYCPVNSFYQICAEPCATPCPGLKGVTCPLQCAEGCACNPGYYFNGTGCVLAYQCGCYDKGRTYKVGESVITDDCSERLTCLYSGHLKREPVKCSSDEICRIQNYERGCYPVKGQCPKNSHFETCASACPATCENPNAPATCHSSCVEACTCDEGFVLRDQKCVRRTECGGAVGGGCVYTMGGQRQHLQTGESVWGDDTCTRKCTCMPNTGKVECEATSCRSGEQCGVVNGKRDCYPVAPKSSATCSISAGTHYRTFDNTIYNFQSNCTYIASKACHLEGTQVKPFTVEVENGRLRRVSPLSDLSVAKSVSVEVYGLTLVLQMNQKGAVIVNGVSAYLPLSLHNGQVQVYQEGFHYVIATDFGLKVTYDLEYHVAISVPTSYQGKTCGLCGNLNGNKNDDLRLPDGKETKDINSFGNAWIVPGQGAYCNKALPTPTCQEATKRVYEATCNIITNPSGPFAACHRVLTPESYFNDCVYDLCSSEGARKMLCDSIAAYVQDCQSLGVAVQSWRTPTFCPLYCPVNSFYQICAEPCATPCPGLKGVTCPLQCAEGCACNPGYYFNGTGCVLAYQCGCYDKGRTYKVGESVITDDCSERLTCLYSGHLKREPVKCSSDEICRIQNYERGCYPVKGQCPKNSHFETCASACPATCENPNAPATCHSSCVEACTCDEGFVLRDQKCVRRTECGGAVGGGCVYTMGGQRQHLQTGESVWGDDTCTRKCTCMPNTGKVECEATSCRSGEQCGVVNGKRDCYPVAPKSSATCSISAGTHYRTFDNTIYNFQSNCTYIASKACHLEGTQVKPFTVEVENGRLRRVSPLSDLSVAKSVSVEVYGLTLVLQMNQKGAVIVNGVSAYLPLSLHNGQVQVYQEGFHYVIATDFGLKVTYDLEYHVAISVPTSYQGKTCGLCGNLNGNKNDDLRLPDGKETKDINSFGNAWIVPGQGAYCNKALPTPTCQEATKRVYEATCNIITNPSGPFAACHRVLTPESYFNDCVYDLCSSEGARKMLCDSIAAYVQDCQSLGVAVQSWRTPTFCPLYCPVNSFYQICAEPCATPCPGLKGVTCPLQCAEGCACNPGYYFNGTGCVLAYQCGCYDKGRTYKVGESVITDDCSERLTCLYSGHLKREPVKCSSDEICRIQNYERGCYPVKGQCPKNSHFETCASACPATCENPNAPATCHSSCVEACTCDEGFVLRDQKCVRRTECGGAVGGGCVYTMGGQRQHLQTGESVWGDDTCTRKCTCMPNTGKVECEATSCRSGEQCGVVNGKRDCYPVAPKSSATCSISAGTHYRTFDNTIYNFQSNCTYIASKACHLEGTQVKPFTVEVENGRLRRVSPLSDLSVAKSVSVEVYGLTLVLQMNQKGAVIVNGVSAYLPLSLHNGQVQVYQEGFHYVIATDFGLKVTYDLEYHVAISVPTSYQGKTCGLCGNLNGNKNDDLRLPDGKETKDINSFGNAWIVPGQGAYCNKALPTPTCQEATKRVYEATCNIITNPSGPFAACHRVLTPESYFNDCVYDLCSSEGARKMLCDSIAAYVQDCQSLGVAVQSWRTPTFCPLYCPVNSFYQICAEPCATPCPGLKGVTCPLQCAEGCACDPGYYFNGTGCVLAYQCGCYDKGRTYKVGESVITDDCSERLTCLYSGHLKREPVKCSSDEICRIQNYERGCYPVKGQCPKNSHFETCASACPATCENPNAPATCHSSCVEACTCDEGFVLRDQKCVRRTECGGAVGGGCVYTMGGQRQHLQTGESVWGDDTCTRKCTCMPNTGKVECEATSCRSGEQCGVVNGKRDCYPVAPKHQQCTMGVGGSFSLFNGEAGIVVASGPYEIIRVCDVASEAEWFRVVVELQSCGYTNRRSVTNVYVFYEEAFVSVNSKREIWANGRKISHTMKTSSGYREIRSNSKMLSVKLLEDAVVIKSESGLTVSYNQFEAVTVTVSEQMADQVCGACGKLNDKFSIQSQGMQVYMNSWTAYDFPTCDFK